MSKTAIVDGIETFAMVGRTGLAIRCDGCGLEYNGSNGTTKPGPIRQNGYRSGSEETIRADARSLGWTGSMTRKCSDDRCPTCSKNKENG